MLTSVTLKNFKCFVDVTIPLRPLTVFTGINGMGKSSVLQALLLLRQTFITRSGFKRGLQLNGPLISLGCAQDVFYEHATSDSPLTISLTSEPDETFTFSAILSDKESSVLAPQSQVGNEMLRKLSIAQKHFYHLKAERVGPRTSSPVTDYESSRFNAIGSSGEFGPCILARNARTSIPHPSLAHPNQPIQELLFQVEAWLAEIGQSPQIHLSEHHDMDIVGLKFSFIHQGLSSMSYRSTNVGFGLSYSLPIFIACLHCQPGGLVIIENPEAHLHPKGQAALGRFLAKAAACGIQILVETHSDHVLNGIRIAAKKSMIKASDIALNFFDRNKNDGSTSLTSPELDADGRISHWPEGFFDEWEKGLSELL